MDDYMKTDKHKLKANCFELFKLFENHPMKKRCENLADAISIVKVIFPYNSYQDEIIRLYRLFDQLSKDISNKISSNIEETFNQLAIQLSTTVFFVFEFIVNPIQPCIDHCLAAKLSLPHVLSYTITYIFTSLLPTLQSFSVGWELLIKKILTKLNLAEDSNLFAKGFLFSLLFGSTADHYSLPLDASKFNLIPDFLFTDLKNFKFFIKACKIYQLFSRLTKPETFDEGNSALIVTQTSDPNYPRPESFEPIGNKIIEKGIEGSNRSDSLVLIGTHPLCDIRLPATDPNLEKITFAVFYNGIDYYILDCGKKTYLAKKFQGAKDYKVFDGMLISLAGSTIIHLVEQLYTEDDEVSSELIYEFLDGELAGFGKQYKRLLTKQRNGTTKKLFYLGRGSFNSPADICLIQGGRISAQHLYFKFHNCEWFVYDLNSKNGSFVLLKNFGEFKQKCFSSCDLIIGNESTFNCFTVAGYDFYFSKVCHK